MIKFSSQTSTMENAPNNITWFWRELKRRKVVRLIAAYIASSFFLIELTLIISPILDLPTWFLPLIIILLVIGFIVSVWIVWVYDKTPDGLVRTKPDSEEDIVELKRLIHSNEWKVTTYVSLVVIVALVVFHILSGNMREKQLSETSGSSTEIAEKDDHVYLVVENMPQFRVEGYRDFRDYINKEINYPENSRLEGISGRVYVQFVIRSDGSIDAVKVARGINEELDAEAIRVVESSPKWKPGTQNGKAVNVSYSFPVVFELQ